MKSHAVRCQTVLVPGMAVQAWQSRNGGPGMAVQEWRSRHGGPGMAVLEVFPSETLNDLKVDLHSFPSETKKGPYGGNMGRGN